MENKKLQEILDKHTKWLNNEAGGVRANLRYADLRDADLWRASLQNSDLEGANLQGANLWGTNLQSANLWGTNLQSANLRCANLRGARLNWANWHGVDGIKVYVAGLQSSRENAQLTYIPSIDVATTGCWQGTWQETIERIHSVYYEGTIERQAYDLAIEYIQAQMELDNVEEDE